LCLNILALWSVLCLAVEVVEEEEVKDNAEDTTVILSAHLMPWVKGLMDKDRLLPQLRLLQAWLAEDAGEDIEG
jgi:hypothetical protein